MFLKIINNLIRIGFLALAIAAMSWIPFFGVTFSGGLSWALALGAGSWCVFGLARPVVNRVLGIAPNACPCKGTLVKLGLSFFAIACLQVAAAAWLLPSVVTLASWLSALPAGFTMLVFAVLSNIPTRSLEALFGPKPDSKKS